MSETLDPSAKELGVERPKVGEPTPTINESPSQKPEEQPALTSQEEQFKKDRQLQGERLVQILQDNGLAYAEDALQLQIENAEKRFVTLNVVESIKNESGDVTDIKQRFFKAFLTSPDEKKNAENKLSFQRQVKTQEFLDEKTSFPVTEYLDGNTDESQGELWALYNWYPEGRDVGFIHNFDQMLSLRAEHAALAVKAIRDLRGQTEIPADLDVVLMHRGSYQDFVGFVADLDTILAKKVSGGGELYSPDKKLLAEVVGQRLGVTDFKAQADALIAKIMPTIEAVQGKSVSLVHGDLAPNNFFLGDGVASEKLIALDFEHSGISPNEVLAAAYDFGNLRARAWNNSQFRESLDREMIAAYQAEGREELGRAIVALGILRSHLNLSGYFENYPPEKAEEPIQIERREETEKDILKAWETAGLEVPGRKAA